MKRSEFSRTEAADIRETLRTLRRADRDTQKRLRARLRRMGFYITDYSTAGDGFTEGDFEALVRRSTVKIVD